MAVATHDIIDELVGIAPGSRLDQIRAARPEARANAQASYRALLEPAEPGDMTMLERHAVAAFVAGLHERPRVLDFYAARLAAHAGAAVASAVQHAALTGLARGPYGAYPAGPLSAEDRAGLAYAVAPEGRESVGARLAAALEHAHLLVFHPRDASQPALLKLLEAGWTTTGVVTLSQLVAFLSFQIRVIDGLSVLATTKGETR